MSHRRLGRSSQLGYPEKPDQTEFYVQLVSLALRDAATLCNCGSSAVQRDINYVVRRVRAEGMGFLTKALPSLGKSLDKALASGTPFYPNPLFEQSKSGRNHPIFMGDFWRRCLDPDGTITGSDSVETVEAVRAIRQVCYLLYKLRGAHSPDSELKVISTFEEVDRLLPEETEEKTLSRDTLEAVDTAREIIQRVLRGFDPLDIVPGHGPGSLATGEKFAEKMSFRHFYESLDRIYSYSEYFHFNYSHLCDELESLEGMETYPCGTAKVVLVPKDSRGPRLISMEPLELQWIQQGQMRSLVARLESHGLTAGQVNFTDQGINRALALTSSKNGEYITLDMKEASDRVSLWLVKRLFPAHVYEALKASRSEETKLPDGRVIKLKKFAPMGSAVCFPVEALVFWALGVGSILHTKRCRWSWPSFSDNDIPLVWVYGDDIIVHKDNFAKIRSVFEECHLVFNEDKCCTSEFFRESCGVDAYVGFDVTPLKIQAPWSDMSPPTRLSWISYVNNLSLRGYSQTSEFIREAVTKRYGEVPTTNTTATYSWAWWKPFMTEEEVHEQNARHFRKRWNSHLHCWQVRLPVPTPRQILAGSPGWPEMLRLHRFWGLQSQSGEALSPGPCRYTVPHQLKMRWRWISQYWLISPK